MASHVPDDSTLVAAINLFYESVQQSSPYKNISSFQLLRSPPILCTWYHSTASQCDQISNKQIFICDQSSFSVLKLSFMNVSILAEGIAWPHITSCGVHLSAQWIMLGHEIGICPNSLLPPPFIWFIVSPIFQRIFEHTIGLLNLNVKDIPSSSKHCCCLGHSTIASGVHIKEEDTFVKMILSSPGDFLLSVMSPHNLSYNIAAFGHEQNYRTLCVASKHSQWHRESKSTRPYLIKMTELDHHIIVEKIPGNLQSIVHLIIKATVDQLPTAVSLKEDFHCNGSTEGSTNLRNNACNDGGSSRRNVAEPQSNWEGGKQRTTERKGFGEANEFHKPENTVNFSNDLFNANETLHSNVQIQHSKFLKCCKCQNSLRFRILECPKCKKKFQFGLHGSGFKHLIGHVYDHHGRLTSYCMSTIRRKYDDLLNDSDHDKNCYFLKLKMHMLGK